MKGLKCEGEPQQRGGAMTYLVLLILQRVLLLLSLHRHLFDLPLQPAVCQLQVGALPETHDGHRETPDAATHRPDTAKCVSRSV